MHIKFCLEYLKRGELLGDIGIEIKIISKWILRI
jgi:hypothetical protein